MEELGDIDVQVELKGEEVSVDAMKVNILLCIVFSTQPM